MMDKPFFLSTKIHQFDTLDTFVQEFAPTERDLIVSNRFIYDPLIAPLHLPCKCLFQEDYGSGEPTDVMVEGMLKALDLSLIHISHLPCDHRADLYHALGARRKVKRLGKHVVSPAHNPFNQILYGLDRHALALERLGGASFFGLQQAQQQMLCAHIILSQFFRVFLRVIERLLCALCKALIFHDHFTSSIISLCFTVAFRHMVARI